MIKDLKIEDRLWSFTYGWVSITRLDEGDCDYPIEACREGTFDYVTFTSTGASLIEGNRDLFWDEIKFDIPVKPEPTSEQDELVENQKECEWEERYNILLNEYTKLKHRAGYTDEYYIPELLKVIGEQTIQIKKLQLLVEKDD